MWQGDIQTETLECRDGKSDIDRQTEKEADRKRNRQTHSKEIQRYTKGRLSDIEEEKQKDWDIEMENQPTEPTLEGAPFSGMLQPYPQILD